ncbi:hypothetical protein F2P56_023946 [Juglans regia]|uniref:GRF-type domain-containing protein n=2 Tax=Juglans regia TaxID=51240 RepID=A0A833WVU2_JUGRE|nr:uncharacterized protein LOC118343840 [Juglans regia]XP_035541397.1 uncharacterized protein LOC108981219 [Juglans regia]XP_035549385.1 uncharacterized protein LOC118349300 [Juglans regia]XP_035551158.1 uncharacterized protein LOC118349718 [Juglans regia]KAF5447834.1 hypothetical protein F2P56_033354 [Juglans regia]KAF5454269.1 hypothetical protein F2P56_023946 [Juglans regia]
MEPRTEAYGNLPKQATKKFQAGWSSSSAQTHDCPTDVIEDETQREFKNKLVSTTDSSSSFGKPSLGQPLCFCEIEAQLRYSSTIKNPGRPFLGCPNYNTKGLPYCKYFKWVEEDQYKKSDLRETHNELLRAKKELEKILDDIEKSKIDLRKRADEIEMREMTLSNRNEEVVKKELAVLVREAQIRHSRTLLRVYWAAAFVVACYLSCK